MLQLNSLTSLVKSRKRRGRGGALGGTSGRGHKGQKARTGGKPEVTSFFEGGQMPLTRRLPRRGFVNRSRVTYQLLSLRQLESFFQAGETVNEETLRQRGLLKGKKGTKVKVVCNGSLQKSLQIEVHACTQSAREQITTAGGTLTLIQEMGNDRSAA